MSNELLKLGKKYKNLVVLSAGSDAHGICGEFARYFPDRYFSFGLGTCNMVSVAAGFALTGKIPLVVGDRIFSVASEQVRDEVCSPNLNVKFFGGNEVGEGFFSNLETVESFKRCFEEYGPRFLKSV